MCARVRPHTVWNTGTVINAAKFGSNTEHVQVQYLPYSLVFGEVKLHGPILYQALVSVSGKLGLILRVSACEDNTILRTNSTSERWVRVTDRVM